MTTHRSTLRHLVAGLVGLGLGAVLLSASPASPASAGDVKPTRPDYLMLRGSGSWVPSPSGGTTTAPVDVWLPHASEPTAASATATLAPLDGTFPGSEQCEPASLVLETLGATDAAGGKRLGITMASVGTVCGAFTEDPTAFPTQRFAGRYVVTDGAARFRGDDGSVQVELYGGGQSYVFATDS